MRKRRQKEEKRRQNEREQLYGGARAIFYVLSFLVLRKEVAVGVVAEAAAAARVQAWMKQNFRVQSRETHMGYEAFPRSPKPQDLLF